jgi:hypothetical protein
MPDKKMRSPIDMVREAIDEGDNKKLIEDMVAWLNTKYAVVNESGKVLIYAPRIDTITNRKVYDRMSVADLKLLYQNQPLRLTEADGSRVRHNPVTLWLNHKDRRQFIGGVAFDPSNSVDIDVLNLWQGFGVKPIEGDWSFLKDHMLNIVCNGDVEQYEYLMNWMASLVQSPATQGETAIIMRGGEGCGKGILARALKHVIGQHGLAISNARHLTGQFNEHLRDCIFLFADEAFFAGDRVHTGILKSIITEPDLTIEGKFKVVTQAMNYLHLMMASNEEWVVPASLDAWRFAVYNVSNERVGDFVYFAAIAEQLENGGHEAMLAELLSRDISRFNVRKIPQSEGLKDQKRLSLRTHETWWVECLQRGYVYPSKFGHAWFSEWYEQITPT